VYKSYQIYITTIYGQNHKKNSLAAVLQLDLLMKQSLYLYCSLINYKFRAYYLYK